MPAMKSTGSAGIGSGAQRSRLGEHSASRQGAVRHCPSPMRRNAECIAEGRSRFEAYIDNKGGYVYGSTTAPGSRAKVILSEQESRRQGATLRNFISLKVGPGGEMLSERCVRLAVFARLTNAMTGSGKLRPATVRAVANLLQALPDVPLQSVACSGEVMPLSWLAAPLADLPLAIGEAMALINGSPFATAMAGDVALTARRRINLAERVLALSVEAAQCPAGHFDPRLADRWLDPCYRESLERLHALLADSQRLQLQHQAMLFHLEVLLHLQLPLLYLQVLDLERLVPPPPLHL